MQARCPALAGRPWAQDYDPAGAQHSKRPHHPRITGDHAIDKPGAWWQQLQEAQANVGSGITETKCAVLPPPPWAPALGAQRGTIVTEGAKHGCVKNEKRYAPAAL